MSTSERARPTVRRGRSTAAVVVAVAGAAIMGLVLGYQAVATPTSSAAPLFVATPGDGPDAGAADDQDPRDRALQAPGPQPPAGGTGRAVTRGVTIDDGVVPDGVTVFDGEFPAVANLDPDLLTVLREAATAAADDGVQFFVTSGWRSPAYQDQLLREAVSEYGSEKEAARWVATATTSLHVSGDAVDIGPSDATAWLSEHGSDHGLCQIYRNEPWHYELRPGAADHGCPTPYADPTHDPRMQP